jgi:nitroreductase
VLVSGIEALADGVYHYRPDDHALELRARPAEGVPPPAGGPCVLIGLSSVMWREAWKYGERAFRYCQLDAGHGAGALRYAAAVLGWGLREVPQVGHAALAAGLGLNRAADFPVRRQAHTEFEEPELLLALHAPGLAVALAESQLGGWLEGAEWYGSASPIDRFPMYRWKAVEDMAAATRRPGVAATEAPAIAARPPRETGGASAGTVILGRRSAQRFDIGHVMPRADFEAILAATLPSPGAPWDVLARADRLDLLLYVHRVEGMEPGLYYLARGQGLAERTLPQLHAQFTAEAQDCGLPGLRLWGLARVAVPQLQRVARSLHCHQDIASASCFALGMLADFDAAVVADPGLYRELHREAGLVGQALYLHAEARGLRGTGIGCYFDEPVREVVGLQHTGLRTVYHFTVGLPIADARVENSPPY